MFCILGYSQMVDTVLNVSIHKGGQIVNGIVDAVVVTRPWIIGGTYFCRSVSGRYHRFAFGWHNKSMYFVFLSYIKVRRRERLVLCSSAGHGFRYILSGFPLLFRCWGSSSCSAGVLRIPPYLRSVRRHHRFGKCPI